MATEPKVRYLIVTSSEVWEQLVEHYSERGINVVTMPADPDDEPETTYHFLSPKESPRA